MTSKEARLHARELLRRAEKGDYDAANVLVDVVAMAVTPGLAAEDLFLALQRRNYGYGPERGRLIENISPEAYRKNIRGALAQVRQRLFPRSSPCLPNRHDLAALVGRRHLPELIVMMQKACHTSQSQYRVVDRAVRFANEAMNAYGIAATAIETRRGRREVEYVDNTTLLYVYPYKDRTVAGGWSGNRWHITTFSDLVEGWECRWGFVE